MSEAHRALDIEWRDFTFTYRGESQPVLDRFCLRIEAGQLIVLMGASGCGKSTLGLTLNGIIPTQTGGTSEGVVRVGGDDPASLPLAVMAERVGLVFQDPDSQLCTITVRDEIAFGPQNLLVERDEIIRRLDEAAGLVGVGGRLQDNVFDLSGGQKQRVAIAAAMVMRPAVLVMDEPTANLDPQGRAEVLRVLSSILRDGVMTSVVIEHHPGDLLRLADRLVVMAPGGVVLQGPPRDLIATEGHRIMDLGIRLPPAATFWLGVADATMPLPLSPTEIDFDRFGPALPGRPIPTKGLRHAVLPPVLEVQALRFAYDKDREILKGVDFRIGSGEVVALLGQNGSGKSTFAALLSGLNRPSGGEIRIDGANTRKMPVRKLAQHIGYVFQYPEHQFITDRVYDEVAVSLRRLGLSEADLDSRVHDWLRRFDLSALVDKHPFRLSLGQKRRLSIAAMTVYRPRVLVMDEPTFGQDQAHTNALSALIGELSASGIAIIMITHDLRLTADIADRAVVLAGGQIVFDGEPPSLFEMLDDEPRWGLDRLEEHHLWREVARRVPGLAYEPDPFRLGRTIRERAAA